MALHVNMDLMVCHTCLSMDTINALSAEQTAAFTQATGVSVADARLPCALCATCATYLNKAARFREASARADLVLRDLASRGALNKKSIIEAQKTLDTFTKYSIKHFPPNYYDKSINYDENDILIPSDPCIDYNYDMVNVTPDENSIYINEDENFELNDNPISPEHISNDDNNIYNNTIDFQSEDDHKQEEDADQKQDRVSDHKQDREIEPKTTKKKKRRKEKTLSEIRNEKLKKDRLKKLKNDKKKLKNRSKLKNDVDLVETEFVTRQYRKRKTLSKDDQLFEEFFIIDTLTLQEQKEDFALRKETANYSNSKLKCEFCFRGFMHERAYDVHMAKHSEKMGELTCKVCHRHCPSTKVLRKHMDHHKYKFSCKKCQYSTKARSSAKLHIDWHNGKQYDCDKCGQIFTRISTLLSHARIKHPTDHVCGLCGYSFLGEKGIYFHRRLKHRLEDLTIPADGPQCVECDIRFSNEEAWFTHQRVSPRHGECKRNDAPPVPIAQKKHTTVTADKDNATVKKETRGRRPLQNREPKNRKEPVYAKDNQLTEPIPCEQCGLQMFSGTQYRVHFNKVHPNCTRTLFPRGSRPCLCDICGKMFKTPAILTEHMSEHLDCPAPHRCAECGKAFRKKSSLALHKNVHLGRRYPCPICKKLFNQVCNRDRHFTYVHSSVKDVKCDYCEKYFKSDEEKKLHTTYVHFKKPYPKRSRNRRQSDCLTPNKRRREDYIVNLDTWSVDGSSSEGVLVINEERMKH